MASDEKLRELIEAHADAVFGYSQGGVGVRYEQIAEAMDAALAHAAAALAAERARVAPVMDACRDVLAKIRQMQQDTPEPNDLRRKYAREIGYMALEIVVAYEELTTPTPEARNG